MQRENLDQFAPAYDDAFPCADSNRLILGWYPQRVIATAAKASLLELGLGAGHTTPFFSKHFDNHVVVEGSPKVVERFRQLHPGTKTEIVQGYFEEFSTDQKFSTIVLGFVLEHVADPDLILSRYKTFLTPDGTLFITVPNAFSLHKRIGMAAGMIDDCMALGKADLQQGHKRLYSVELLKELLARHDLQMLRLEGIYLKPFSNSQLEALQLSEDVIRSLFEVGIDYPELCDALLAEVKAI